MKNVTTLLVIFFTSILLIGCGKDEEETSVFTGEIAFVSWVNNDGDHIFIMNADGSKQKDLFKYEHYYNYGFILHLSWSPDGNGLAYEELDQSLYGGWRYLEVGIINKYGDMRGFYSDSGDVSFGDWSPDGKYFLIQSGNSIYKHSLKDNSSILWFHGYSPRWCPDGQKIAFTYGQDGNYDIYVLDVNDPANQVCLTTISNNDWGPRWSPDGRKIAFSSDRDGNDEIYVLDVNDPANQFNLSQNSGNDCYGNGPVWSPDGSRILFTSTRDGNSEIYVVNADGSNQTNLSNNSAHDRYPTWSPDGNKIAFESDRTGEVRIFVMDSDGSNQTDISRCRGEMPAWKP